MTRIDVSLSLSKALVVIFLGFIDLRVRTSCGFDKLSLTITTGAQVSQSPKGTTYNSIGHSPMKN